SHVFARRVTRRELSPELRWLLLVVPLRFDAARREVAFLRAGRIFIASYSGDKRVPAMLGDSLLQGHGLELMRYRHWIVRLVTDPALASFGVYFHDQLKAVLPARPVTELQHLGEFIGGVDM